MHGDVIVRSGPAVRTGYRQQVLRIAPDQLLNRETELAELAAFCTEPDQNTYAWWRAPAWAGKSALLSWFVLHPPKGVQVVPFFITARFAAQNDRIAFTDVVVEQLADLLGQPMPAYLTETTREAHLLRLLAEAALACQERGQRLVLVVDGLDEDRGVTTGPDAYSIAALLPARLHAGMRVLVAGRPNPPIPADVPEAHPLRDPRIVRTLAGSPHAAAVKIDGERELKRLLHGTPLEQDLLGLVTAAGGGLSATDLAELTGCPGHDIEQHLQTVAGRTFSVHTSHWRPADGPGVYVLGHEELQTTAVTVLGEHRLAGYRDRLHQWADQYRNDRWPPRTPEYLFRGYYRMLHNAVDLSRLVACATDTDRHNRMRDITGADAEALTEITAAQDRVLGHSDPDLLDIAVLAAHRDDLVARNNFPHALPALWAVLGRPDRAEALARSMGDPDSKVLAMAALAKTVAALGDHGRAAALADTIESLAHHTTPHPRWQARRLAALAEAVAASGDRERAVRLADALQTLAGSITDFQEQADVLAALAQAATASGDRDRATAAADTIEELARAHTFTHWQEMMRPPVASYDPASTARRIVTLEAFAHSITDSQERADVLASLEQVGAVPEGPDRAAALVATVDRLARATTFPYWQLEVLEPLTEAVAVCGDRGRAAALADTIEGLARLTTLPFWRDSTISGSVLAGSVKAVATSGDVHRAAGLANTLERLAGTCTDLDMRAQVWAATAGAMAVSGNLGRAETLARSITDPYWQSEALVSLAEALAAAGDRDRAAALAATIESRARTTPYPSDQARGLASLAEAVAASGDRARAAAVADTIERLARTTPYPNWQADVLAALVRAVAASGDFDRAEALARSITGSRQGMALAALGKAVVTSGDFNRAEALARSIADSSWQEDVLASLVGAVAASGDFDRADALARSITDSHKQAEAHGEFMAAMLESGEFDRAEALARSITDPYQKAEKLVVLAKAAAAAGNTDCASALADTIAVLARTADDPDMQDTMVLPLVKAMVVVGHFDRAEALALTLAHTPSKPYPRVTALGVLMKAVAAAGEHDRAAALADRGESVAHAIPESFMRALALVDLVEAVAASGSIDRAVMLAETIFLPGWQASALRRVAQHAGASHARLLVARAFCVDSWERSLDSLHQIDPSALAALVDERTGVRAPGACATSAGRGGAGPYGSRRG
ncbi:hypothetical protein [Streptomyces sp. NPDC006463]|uniref:hypothetical protein n=1 Tax=Streptomyces sp. NPDC006463 TaxID=3364746 RepID=UPI00367ED759